MTTKTSTSFVRERSGTLFSPSSSLARNLFLLIEKKKTKKNRFAFFTLVFYVLSFIYLFSPFYWAGFVAQRERAEQDSKVPYKVPHLTQPPFTYERQPQHRDHPTYSNSAWVL